MTDDSLVETSGKHPEAEQSPWFRRAIIALFVVAACVRAIDVWRPIDGSVRQSWRETDTGAIARNFYREDMNILLPRIDWRGDGPGYVESEFPLFPWTAACLYHVVGYHEEILRVLSFVLSLASCVVFLRLAQRLLPRPAILPAWIVFALSPMPIRMASAVQPEPLMFFSYLLAIDAFLRWIDNGRRLDYLVALMATTLAILAKVPAAHVGILFACLCIQKFGSSVFRRREIWLFGVVSLGVPLAWYSHARSLWLEYGNSLGISNEAYNRISSGNFLLTLWETIPGVLSIQSAHIWMGGGLLFGTLGLRAVWKTESSRPLAWWFVALTAFFVVTGRTTGESWASYYHIVSTPVAALLIGLGFHSVWQSQLRMTGRVIVVVFAATVIAFLATEINASMMSPIYRVALVIGAAAAAAGIAIRIEQPSSSDSSSGRRRRLIAGRMPAFGCLGLVLAGQMYVIQHDLHPDDFAETYNAARTLVPLVPEGSLIIVDGAGQTDQHGLLRASDVPYYLFWMDRKGFILHNDDLSLSRIRELQSRGARFYVADRWRLGARFEAELRDSFTVLLEHGTTMLIDLGPTIAAPPDTSQASASDVDAERVESADT